MKKLLLFGFCNLFILLGSIGVGIYAHSAAGRYFAPDVIFIAPMLNESHLHWSMDNVNTLRWQFLDYSFSAESRGNAFLASSTHRVSTTVVYTDAAYFNIHFLDFIDGNRWLEDANAIVLNEALAWRLFGGSRIAGAYVTINDRPYTVAGVVRQGPRGVGEYMAWMPRDTSPFPLPVTALYVLANNYNLVDIYAHTRGNAGMLRGQFRNPDDYAIININRYIEAIGLRARIFMYILWLYILVLLIRVCINKRGKLNLQKVLSFILPVAGILLAVYVLFTGMGEVLYWLPNLSLPGTSVLTSFTNIGILPPDGYLPFGLRRLAELNRLGNIAWIVGAVAFVNLIFCTAILKGASTE